MKKVLFFCLSILGAAGIGFAHPPSIGAIGYDAASGLLTIEINHDITATAATDPTKHFVKEVDVTINGAKAVVQGYTFQESTKSMKAVYRLVQKSGDKIMVQAFCALRGDNAKEIIVP